MIPPIQSANYNVYKSHDSGISSNGFNGFYASPNSKLQREAGDGEEFVYNNVSNIQNSPNNPYASNNSHTLQRVYEKYPVEPPELPPRDYTTDEDNLEGETIGNGTLFIQNTIGKSEKGFPIHKEN